MSPWHPAPRSVLSRAAALAALALALSACASRALPATLPPTSAASPQAPALPPEEVARSLREEVPLPGEPTAGWWGLEDEAHAAPAPEASADHGARAGHGEGGR